MMSRLKPRPFLLHILLVSMCSLSLTLNAQIQQGRFSLGLRASAYKYWGDFSSDFFGFGAEASLRYDISPWVGLQVNSGAGSTSFRVSPYELRDFPEYYQGRTLGELYPGTLTRIDSINDIRFIHNEFSAVFHLLPSNDFVPQAYVGMGVLNHYATNHTEHSPLPRILDYRYSRWSMVFPVGIGFEYFATEDLSINARAIVRVSTTDNLDDLSPSSSSNDYFATFGGGLQFYMSGTLDSDGDGIPNKEERRRGLDPNAADTDGDGLTDYEEIHLYHTDPNKADTDGDGLLDGEEIEFHSSPLKTDTDADGLHDADERAMKTNPTNPDTDGDGLRDGDEVHRTFTNPLKADSDGDGLSDSEEQRIGTNLNNPDTDGDGLSDGTEVNESHTNPLKQDTDGDGLSDAEEVQNSATDPLNPDTDNDGLLDGEDVLRYKSNPKNADTDFDGWSDGEEVLRRCTNPANPDTDGDGIIDPKDPEPCGPGCCCCCGKQNPPLPKAEEPIKQAKAKKNFSIKFLKNSDVIDASDAETQRSLHELKDYLSNECEKIRVTF